MSNPLTDLVLRFSDIVFAIDTTPKSLRKWLQNDKLSLDSDSQSGWRNFSLFDLAILAIMRKLVDFGISVEVAHKIARDHLCTIPGWPDDIVIIAGAPHRMPDSFFGRTLVVAREGSAWATWKFDRDNPLDRSPEVGELDAKLVLNLESIVRRAWEKATERATQAEPVDVDANQDGGTAE